MTSTPKVIIYGAYGYTGKLTARMASDYGLRPILAGRNADKVRQLADELGYDYRVFGLEVSSTIDSNLGDVDVVIHCAGPFSRTAQPMVDACLRTGTHYLDITGEIDVFEMIAALDENARAAGVMLLPGAGFDVVPTDCMAVYVANKVPGATRLTLGFQGVGAAMSHGTATTMVESLPKGSAVRAEGTLKKIRPGSLSAKIDFGRGPRLAMAIPWGDLATAYRSTGIPNIEVFVPVRRTMLVGARVAGFLGPVIGLRPVQRFLKWRVDRRPAGPDDEARARSFSIIYAKASDAEGNSATARLRTPNGYTLTAAMSLILAKRALAGDAPAGFQTPAMAYGPDVVLEVEGVVRTDVTE